MVPDTVGNAVALLEPPTLLASPPVTAPEPLTVGTADVSVLVQDALTSDAVIDADVEIRLRPLVPDGACVAVDELAVHVSAVSDLAGGMAVFGLDKRQRDVEPRRIVKRDR